MSILWEKSLKSSSILSRVSSCKVLPDFSPCFTKTSGAFLRFPEHVLMAISLSPNQQTNSQTCRPQEVANEKMFFKSGQIFENNQ